MYPSKRTKAMATGMCISSIVKTHFLINKDGFENNYNTLTRPSSLPK